MTTKMDDSLIICKVTLKSCFHPFVLPFAIALPIIPFWLYLQDRGSFDLQLIIFAELCTVLLVSSVLVAAYFLQRKRRVTADTNKRIVVFENFPVAMSFVKTRVHRELVVPLSDITVTGIWSNGIGMFTVVCPTGRLRVYGYLTNYEKLKKLLRGGY